MSQIDLFVPIESEFDNQLEIEDLSIKEVETALYLKELSGQIFHDGLLQTI